MNTTVRAAENMVRKVLNTRYMLKHVCQSGRFAGCYILSRVSSLSYYLQFSDMSYDFLSYLSDNNHA